MTLTKHRHGIDDRLQVLETDIEELCLMVAELKQPKPSHRFAKLSAEEKVVAAYNDVLSLAKELGVTLPPR